jgi:hypothetical protein
MNDNNRIKDMMEAFSIHLYNFVDNYKEFKDYNNKLDDLYKSSNTLQNQIYRCNGDIDRIEHPEWYDRNTKKEDIEKEKREKRFLQPCRSDSCKGYLNNHWKCEMCENYTCKECFGVIGKMLPSKENDVEHKCDPNEVETAKLIKQDTKPCPQCHTLIYKISGCDQMWCTVCHLTFSWRTGRKENTIHNPHYYEWLFNNNGNENANNMNDIICNNNELTYNHIRIIRDSVNTKKHLNEEEIYRLRNYVRTMIHNRQTVFNHFNNDYFERNKNLRIKYLVDELDEDTFKLYLQRSEKRDQKEREIYQVLDLLSSVFLDIINKFIDKKDDDDYVCEIFNEIETIRNYCNDLLKEISNTYKCKLYSIDENLYFYLYN